MRQAGILAAAGIYALNHNVDRLAEDHRRAAELAKALSEMESMKLAEQPQTNMVILDIPEDRFIDLRKYSESKAIRLSTQRLVFHRDIDDSDLARIIDTFRSFDQSGHD